MKKLSIWNYAGKFLAMSLAGSILLFTACKEEEPAPAGDPIATFTYAISTENFLSVSFNSEGSQNAASWAWNFGDDNVSVEQNPTHVYTTTGDYTVSLQVTNADGKVSNVFTEAITITDPNEALKLLTGETSKTWKLFREGTSMSVGPDATNPGGYWPGLTNDGARPCLYKQEFTFGFDGTYTFDDKGEFWLEFGVFNNNSCTDNVQAEACIDVTGGTLFNSCNNDVSAWLSGTHTFTYDASTGDLTLKGDGAWIGIPKLSTNGETIIPVTETIAKISIEQFTGYDVMLVEFIYDGVYWPIYYASYSEPSLEPALVTEQAPPPACDPYTAVAYTELSRTFASAAASEFVQLDTIASGYEVVYGVDDPTDAAAAKVGEITRVAGNNFQELQFQTTDPGVTAIDFTNISTVSIDVYLPSSNDYTAGLTDKVIVGLGATKCPPNWWEDNLEFSQEGVAKDTWVTLTWNITAPSFVAVPGNGATPKDRNDFDMVYINIGGGGHPTGATFYVRNLIFQ
jgi:PKD repeat protein